MKNVFVISLAIGTAACGGSQGTNPQDMSAAQHEQSAGAEMTASAQHAAQYDPDAVQQTTRCAKTVCWTADANPTKEHYEDFQKHRELAAKHRAAAESLRVAEQRECAGLDEEDRDVSPFLRREDIVDVTALQNVEPHGRSTHAIPSGGRAIFRALPGLTPEWMQRLVDCHRARAASVGFDMPDMEYCPLVLKGTTAKVVSVGNGVAVDVTSADPATAKAIVDRMQAARAQ
jgi:hypothetical protein